MHGEVGADAKLKSIDVEHTQEVFIVASGGIVIRGGVTRKVRIDMPGGKYDPADASVVYFGDRISGDSGASGFASTAQAAIGAYENAEPRWTSFPPTLRRPGLLPREQHAETEERRRKTTRRLRQVRQDGGQATGARWTLLSPENADFSPTSSQDPAPKISYTVTNAPKGGQVKVTVKFTSTAGVGEKSWTQPTEETEAINKISGTFSHRTEIGGSVFEAAGNATFLRFTPAIFSPAEGSFKLANGLYTFTVSGKAAVGSPSARKKAAASSRCTKKAQFVVFSQAFNEEPPYEYNFSVSRNSSSLPMIRSKPTAARSRREELEGDNFEYPATMSVYTRNREPPRTGSTTRTRSSRRERTMKSPRAWNFTGSK